MIPDLQQHGAGLLEWLYDHSGDGSELPGIDTYLGYHGLSSDNGYLLVDHLVEQGLVEDISTFSAPGARILTPGIARVQRLRADRDGPTDKNQEDTMPRGFSINHRAIAAMSREIERSFARNPVRIPVELDDSGTVRAIGGTVHNYNGPVINGNVSGAAVLAWNHANVTQNQPRTNEIAPGYERLAEAVVAVLQQLPVAGLDEQDRADAEAAANEILAEVVLPEPEPGKVRRSLATLKGFLANLATGETTGAIDGAKEWAQTAITQLNVPFGS